MAATNWAELLGRDLAVRAELFFASVADRAGINTTDLRCLVLALGERGGISAGSLASATGLTSGAITAAVDRLVGAGLASRSRDTEDRRRVLVHARPEGASRLAPYFSSFGNAVTRLVDGRSETELQTIRGFLADILDLYSEEARNAETGS